MSDAKRTVSVIILNWNGWEDTLVSLQSLLDTGYPALQMIVCDNGSDDESVERIKTWGAAKEREYRASDRPLLFTESDPRLKGSGFIADSGNRQWRNMELVLIQTGSNLGFARGNNVGIRHALGAGAEYIFVLNNDTRVRSDCIHELVNFGEKNPHVALVGPRVLDEGSMRYSQGRPVMQRVGFFYMMVASSPLRHFFIHTERLRNVYYIGDKPAAVYAIVGSAMMFRAWALKEIELLDEATFLYWEEFIVAEKLLQRNYPTFIVPNAVIWHKQNTSTTKLGARKFIENVRSERHFLCRYLRASRWKRMAVNVVRFSSYTARALVDARYRRSFPLFIKVFLGIESN